MVVRLFICVYIFYYVLMFFYLRSRLGLYFLRGGSRVVGGDWGKDRELEIECE